jgi:hypothetical protein
VRQRVLHWLLYGGGVPQLRIGLEAHLVPRIRDFLTGSAA